MNTNERNEMVKPEELNIMPEAVQTEVKATDENPVDETKQKVEVVENINDLSLEMGEDDEEIEETETEYDFSACNKLQLIEILEETVQDTDVVKIKDKVVSIKSNFLRICKEERDQESPFGDGQKSKRSWADSKS